MVNSQQVCSLPMSLLVLIVSDQSVEVAGDQKR